MPSALMHLHLQLFWNMFALVLCFCMNASNSLVYINVLEVKTGHLHLDCIGEFRRILLASMNLNRITRKIGSPTCQLAN